MYLFEHDKCIGTHAPVDTENVQESGVKFILDKTSYMLLIRLVNLFYFTCEHKLE
jgi:hypothetical protein